MTWHFSFLLIPIGTKSSQRAQNADPADWRFYKIIYPPPSTSLLYNPSLGASPVVLDGCVEFLKSVILFQLSRTEKMKKKSISMSFLICHKLRYINYFCAWICESKWVDQVAPPSSGVIFLPASRQTLPWVLSHLTVNNTVSVQCLLKKLDSTHKIQRKSMLAYS